MRTGLGELAAHQHGAFSYRQAVAWYTPDEVRARVASGRWIRVLHGAYRAAEVPVTTALQVSAAALSLGVPVVACRHTAANLHGFGVLTDGRTHVAVPPCAPLATRSNLAVHQLSLGPADVVEGPGSLRSTSPARTAVELARLACRRDAIAVLDAALGYAGVTRGELVAEVNRQRGMPGVRQARELVSLADGRVESPQESRLRLVCLDGGLPPPQPQFPVLDRSGRARYWLDLGWPERMVGVEYDGAEFHEGGRWLRRDRTRHNWLVDRGWQMFYATDLDVYQRPDELVRMLRAALLRG